MFRVMSGTFTRSSLLAAALTGAALSFAACGGDDETASTPGQVDQRLAATPVDQAQDAARQAQGNSQAEAAVAALEEAGFKPTAAAATGSDQVTVSVGKSLIVFCDSTRAAKRQVEIFDRLRTQMDDGEADLRREGRRVYLLSVMGSIPEADRQEHRRIRRIVEAAV